MKSRLKCYISAPGSFDISQVELILDGLNIEHHSFYDFSIGTTFSDLIRRKIRESDFIIAIVSGDFSNVLFELGAAEGLNKPSFILIDKDIKIPYYLNDKLYYQTNFKEWSLIQLGLQNFIKDLNIRKKRPEAEENSILSVDDTTEYLIQIKKLRDSPNERDLIILIKAIFSSLGIQNMSINEPEMHRGADLIIQSSNTNPFFSYPIFVELKAGALKKDNIIMGFTTLMHSLNQTEARGGLLLYLDSKGKRFEDVLPSLLIFSFDLEDFVNGLASKGFERLLIDKRNYLAHGRS